MSDAAIDRLRKMMAQAERFAAGGHVKEAITRAEDALRLFQRNALGGVMGGGGDRVAAGAGWPSSETETWDDVGAATQPEIRVSAAALAYVETARARIRSWRAAFQEERASLDALRERMVLGAEEASKTALPPRPEVTQRSFPKPA